MGMHTCTFPEVDTLPKQAGFPDPFLRGDGKRVQSQDDWVEHRVYLKEMLQHYLYGKMPKGSGSFHCEILREQSVLNNLARCVWFTLHYERNGQVASLRCNVIIPQGSGPFPVIIKNTFNLYYTDADVFPAEFQGTERVRIEDDEAVVVDALQRGYALCKFIRTDLAADEMGARDTGIYPLYPECDWGAIAVWSWAYQSVIDTVVQMPEIDAMNIIATGHSRGGKTALCAGIYDERISLVVPNSSGTGGTGSLKFFDSEAGQPQTIASHKGQRDYWWGPRYLHFANKEEKLPFDAHTLKSLIAPRLLLNPHALQDFHANPYGTELSHCAAQRVYQWLGCDDHIAMHWRDGGHAQNQVDWCALLDFADMHIYGKKCERRFDRRAYPDACPVINW